jgi:hypothetical protein
MTRNPAVRLATIRPWTADYLATAIALAEAHLRATTRHGILADVDGKEVTIMTRGNLATTLDRMYRVRAERRKDAERPGRDDLGDPTKFPVEDLRRWFDSFKLWHGLVEPHGQGQREANANGRPTRGQRDF